MYSIYRNNRKEALSKTDVITDLNIDNETFVTTTSTWNTNSKLDTKRSITLTANTSLTITNSVNGQKGYLIVTQNSTGGFTLTVPNNSKGNSVIDKRANAVTLLTFVYDGTNYVWNSIVSEQDFMLKGTLVDNFFHQGYNPIFLELFTFNSSYAYPTPSTTTNIGIVTYETGTNANGIAGLRAGNNNNPLNFGTTEYTLRLVFRIPNTLADGTNSYFIIAGFSDVFGSSASTTDNTVDGVYLYYDQTNTNFKYITKSNSVTTNQDSGVTVATGTFYELKIVINKAGTNAVFTINNANSYTATTNIPTGTTRNTNITIAIAKTLGTAARNLDIDYLQFTYDRT